MKGFHCPPTEEQIELYKDSKRVKNEIRKDNQGHHGLLRLLVEQDIPSWLQLEALDCFDKPENDANDVMTPSMPPLTPTPLPSLTPMTPPTKVTKCIISD